MAVIKKTDNTKFWQECGAVAEKQTSEKLSTTHGVGELRIFMPAVPEEPAL